MEFLTNSCSITTYMHPFIITRVPEIHHPLRLTSKTKTLSSQTSRGSIRCNGMREQKAGPMDYYELLGVSLDSTAQEIKEAYRKLQKKHHPDIAGQKGHEYTLLLNEAYHVLIREEQQGRRCMVSNNKRRGGFASDFSGSGYSSWNGPLRSQALFVDENKCIGCRECVHCANKTFVMDETGGSARVKVQFGDDDKNIKVSVDACPVNCIHWVDSGELPLLEFLIRPQPKESYGVYGGGWERPGDVFSAAKRLKKHLEREENQCTHGHSYYEEGDDAAEEETPAQVKARQEASMKLRLEKYFGIWGWLGEVFISK
ncbi:chaperone protein dnaJ C76, chloroplastic-like isoform X1 [Dioscorea cayenensis subsp. rotundata]|uniref:Chaperone protein dnaJ C76, chloroplastic-like isoform X1 n=1 Tax=Dioscorea cayennensis subsp. rotundata TaxID=55577 RepID=A0AB40BAX9_DIOCR|nr:chaperone protein dnaJ C76, chloroplastic-like isoform X1 [Dioscorea cayenensis subsp. rotundata]